MGIVVGNNNPKTIKSEEIGNAYRQGMNNAAEAAKSRLEEDRLFENASKQSVNRLDKPEETGGTIDEHKAEIEAEKAAKEAERKALLEKIMAMPEEERVGALIDAGFNQEAAAENQRIADAKNWSALITVLNKYGVINIADENTHDILEKASDPAGTNEDRIAFVRENGIETLASLFEKVVSGETTVADIENEFEEKAKAEAEAAAKAEEEAKAKAAAENAGAGESAPADEAPANGEGGEGGEGTEAPGTGDADGKGDGEGGDNADSQEKRKPGRPAGSTNKK